VRNLPAKSARSLRHPAREHQGGGREPLTIYPRSVWSLPHTKDARSAKGYLRAWFETVWDSYCREEDGNPASAGSVTHLRGA